MNLAASEQSKRPSAGTAGLQFPLSLYFIPNEEERPQLTPPVVHPIFRPGSTPAD